MSEKMTAEKREFILTLEDQKKNQITKAYGPTPTLPLIINHIILSTR